MISYELKLLYKAEIDIKTKKQVVDVVRYMKGSLNASKAPQTCCWN